MDTKLNIQPHETKDETTLLGDSNRDFEKESDQVHEEAFSSSSLEAQGKYCLLN